MVERDTTSKKARYLTTVEKSARKFSQKRYRSKTFAHSNESQKLQFPVNFPLIIFSHAFFAPFSTDSKSASNFAVFIPIFNFWIKIFLVILALFENFEVKRGRNGSKN
jgi:hypothetical protein